MRDNRGRETVRPLIFILSAFFLAALSSACATEARNSDVTEATAKASAIKEKTEAANAALLGKISESRRAKLADMAAKQKELDGLRAKIEELRSGNRELEARSKELERSLRDEEFEKESLRRSLGEAAGEMKLILERSLTRFENPSLLAGAALFPGRAEEPSRNFTAGLFEAADVELLSSGRILRYQGTFVSPSGGKIRGHIVRAGGLQCYGLAGDEVFLLKSIPGGGFLHAVDGSQPFPGQGPGSLKDAVRLDRALFDLSGGAPSGPSGPAAWFSGKMTAGGPLMWPILLVGLLGVLFVIERAVVLMRVHTDADRLMAEVTGLLSGGAPAEAMEACRRRGGPVSRVILAGLMRRGEDRQSLENAMEEAILHEQPLLERHLTYIGVIVACAPLLGLLGTVTGMIFTFDMITLHGTGDPRMLSGGIAEALITTEFGLYVAIPTLLAHGYLSDRVDRIMDEMEKNAAALCNRISEASVAASGAGRASPGDATT